MKRIDSKIHRYTEAYLSTLVVLLIDICISMGASVCTLLIARFGLGIHITAHLSYVWLLSAFCSSLACFLLLKTYQNVIRHSRLSDIWKFVACALGKAWIVGTWLLIWFPAHIIDEKIYALTILDGVFTFCLLVVVRVFIVVMYGMLKRSIVAGKGKKRVWIYGVKDKSVALITRLQHSQYYKIVGFLVYGKHNRSYKISGLPVYQFNNLVRINTLQHIDAILFATETDAQEEQERLIKYALRRGIKILYAPSIDESVDGKCPNPPVREIKIEDLLGRKEIKISLEAIKANFNGKTVLITGAAGSIGSELCRQLATFGIKQLILFDNAETPMHHLRLELEQRFPELKFVPVVGDVRIPARLDLAFRTWHPDIVFHAAAYKHVPLMEENPCEAVLVNVIGTRNVADKCLEYNVEEMVMISTDKAVNPTNIMGCTKRLAEIYVQSLGLAIEQEAINGKTKFITTRFGNVLGSNGSVILRFRDQIASGGPVTVTHPEIIRFFMTIPEACRLVMEAATISTGNEIMAFDMGEPVKVDDLARRMIELAGFVPDEEIKIAYTGLRPGEKLYEEVLSDVEQTLPTTHDRIRIANVRTSDYAKACAVTDELESLSRKYNITEMVKLMKKTVPEYISNNSVFEELDKV